MEVENTVNAGVAYTPPKPQATQTHAEMPKRGAERTERAEAKHAEHVPIGGERNGGDERDQKVYLDLPGHNTIRSAVDNVNKHNDMTNRYLDMRVHEKTQRIIIKVMDNETGEVVREVPPAETLDFLANLLEQAGVFVDTRG
jgi:flagellar protein FlaG